MASPFVEGQLRGETVEATIETACADCGQPITIHTDGEGRAEASGGAAPLVFAPLVDFSRWEEPSIIDGF